MLKNILSRRDSAFR